MSTIDGHRLTQELRQFRYNTELDFLKQWALFSAGTFSLLVPFLQSIEKSILSQNLLVVGGILLVLSFVSSLVGMFFLKEHTRGFNLFLSNASFFTKKKFTLTEKQVGDFFGIAAEIASSLTMIFYIAGIILIALFIGANLL